MSSIQPALMESWPQHADWLLLAAHLLVALVVSVHVLLFKSSPASAFGWLLTVLLVPLLGALIYWVFGINRIWNQAARERGLTWSDLPYLPARTGPLDVAMGPLERVGAEITGRALCNGNTVTPLFDGEQAFPAMLDAIDSARSEVLLATYIFDYDGTGVRFIEALQSARRRGVRVCVLLDDVGRRASFPTARGPLREADIATCLFMPLRLFPPSLSINLRNHRKLLLVDERVGFAGGMNIGDRQLVRGDSTLRASDLHFSIEGPLVGAMRHLFADDWQRSGGAPISQRETADQLLQGSGTSACRLIADGPDERLDHLALAIEGVVSAAEDRVVIITPYFLPEKRLVGALQSAALRGVDVLVVIPERCNWPFVRWALDHTLWELLSVGVRVQEQHGIFAHSKCLLIDDRYAMIGSSNIDARSLRLNFELGIEVLDPVFVQQMVRFATAITDSATLITRERLSERGLFTRIRDAVAALFTPYL